MNRNKSRQELEQEKREAETRIDRFIGFIYGCGIMGIVAALIAALFDFQLIINI